MSKRSTEWPDQEALVAIVMGSDSDYKKIAPLIDALVDYRISYALFVISAHRHPARLDEFIASLPGTNVRFIVAVAGMAAHLGGVIASKTHLPVFGIPVHSANDPDGSKAKFAMSELPPGATQVAVLADTVQDNCFRIANLMARILESQGHHGLGKFIEEAGQKKGPQVPFIPRTED